MSMSNPATQSEIVVATTTATSAACTCGASAIGQCANCGKGYCAQHGGTAAGYGERCRACYGDMLANLVFSARKADRLNEVAETLAQTPVEQAAPEHGYYSALALSSAGQLDRAIECLRALLKRTLEPPTFSATVRGAAGALLSMRAVQSVQNGNVIGAAEDLRESLSVAREAQDGSRRYALLLALTQQAGYAYFARNELDRAQYEWEHAQVNTPQDLQLAHSLAVTAYRRACAAEAQKDQALADSQWKKAIANWTLIFANEAFWSAWSAGRVSAVGAIDAAILGDIRQKTTERFYNDFRDYRSSYLQANEAANAARHANYEIMFRRELRAAEEMAAVLAKQNQSQSGVLQVACGPLMLEIWGSSPQGGGLVQAANALAAKGSPLQVYLSPLGMAYTIIKDLRRPADGEKLLDEHLQKNKDDKDAQVLLVDALTMRGQDYLQIKAYNDALAVYQKAANHSQDADRVIGPLVQCAVEYTRAQLADSANIQASMNLLEQIEKTVPRSMAAHQDLMAQLSQVYLQRAFKRNKEDDNTGSLQDINRALELNPGNQNAKDNLIPAMMNYIGDLVKNKNWTRAFDVMNEALEKKKRYDLAQAINRDLAVIVYFNHGIDRANAAIQRFIPGIGQFHACHELGEALQELTVALTVLEDNEPQFRLKIVKEMNAIREMRGKLGCF